MTKLDRVIHKTLFDCLHINQKDSLLILADEFSLKLGRSFFEKALKINKSSLLLETAPFKKQNSESSPTILKIVKQVSAVIVLSSNPLIYPKLIKHICHNGSRVVFVNPEPVESLERAVNVDYEFLQEKGRRIADLFSIGKEVKLTSEAGTNVTFKIGRHKGSRSTGVVKEAGCYGFLPAGEASITPDKNSSNGVAVIDASIPQLGLVEQPFEVQIKKGIASHISGNGLVEDLRKILKSFGSASRNIAEFGIGTNPKAILTGNSIEDEKVLGTAHIALGHHLFEGGSIKKNLHVDLILKKPTVEIDGHLILKNGKMII